MRYSLMIQLVATITLIFLGTAAMFAWLQYRPGLEDVPTSIAEALKYDDPEKNLQFHTGTTGGGGGERSAMFHGQGAGNDEQERSPKSKRRGISFRQFRHRKPRK
jgi:hypothetical protein